MNRCSGLLHKGNDNYAEVSRMLPTDCVKEVEVSGEDNSLLPDRHLDDVALGCSLLPKRS
ncbi:MAG: hypothetical protein AAGA96_19405 [Verrucomicrobiota bacterium]